MGKKGVRYEASGGRIFFKTMKGYVIIGVFVEWVNSGRIKNQ
jgi:hypothetical protein